MTIDQKVERLNEYCDNTLGFTHYSAGWDINSYGDRTLFSCKEKLYKKNGGYLEAKTFKGVVNLAYKEMLKDTKGKK